MMIPSPWMFLMQMPFDELVCHWFLACDLISLEIEKKKKKNWGGGSKGS